MISINEKFEEFMEQVKAFNFSYVLTTDLDEWKKNINKEYLIKKELKEVIDELGIESVPRLHKVVIEAVDHVLLNDLETKIIDNWFLPYKHIIWYTTPSKDNYKPSKYSLYAAAQNKLHDKPSEDIKVNSKGYQ
jgi:DNA-directed RNA polymerase subunit N (RpoN/RPB10)